jgi:hypothetical protein
MILTVYRAKPTSLVQPGAYLGPRPIPVRQWLTARTHPGSRPCPATCHFPTDVTSSHDLAAHSFALHPVPPLSTARPIAKVNSVFSSPSPSAWTTSLLSAAAPLCEHRRWQERPPPSPVGLQQVDSLASPSPSQHCYRARGPSPEPIERNASWASTSAAMASCGQPSLVDLWSSRLRLKLCRHPASLLRPGVGRPDP